MADAKYGILIDYEWCSNCHTCEIACKEEHDIPEGKWGIKIFEVGPWNINGDDWQLTYMPVPTDICDLCAERTAKGKLPSCVHSCFTGCMTYGSAAELAKELDKKDRQVLFVPKQD
jgi:anaerobic dimethyl sulfoxide reductase subunit B (iron-sulfur subunit)